jgi:NADH dehydrogenase [ubiquinone] 1 alpha subcomplex assembly factor 6
VIRVAQFARGGATHVTFLAELTRSRAFSQSRPPPHPLATLFSTLPQRPHLSSYHFTRLINAREAHFLNPSFASLQDLADYSAGTQASLLYLLLQATAGGASGGGVLRHAKPFEHVGNEHGEDGLGFGGGGGAGKEMKEPDDLTLDHAASHLAVATTIAILLRSIPHHAAKRINVIPMEIGSSSCSPLRRFPANFHTSPFALDPASRHSLKEEALFRQGPSAPGLRESVATLVGIAEAELRTSRACFDGTTGIPVRAAPVFLSAVRTFPSPDFVSLAET